MKDNRYCPKCDSETTRHGSPNKPEQATCTNPECNWTGLWYLDEEKALCGCGDSHCETCNPDWLMWQSIQEGIDHAEKEMQKVGENPIMVKVIAQFAAGKAIEFYMKHNK